MWGALAPYSAALYTRAVYAVADHCSAWTGTPGLERGPSFSPPVDMWVVARSWIALVGLLTVWLTWRLGHRLDGPLTGLAAAALVARRTWRWPSRRRGRPTPTSPAPPPGPCCSRSGRASGPAAAASSPPASASA